MVMWHLDNWSLECAPHKHIFSHLENKICRPEHLCSTQCFIMMLFPHTFFLYQKKKTAASAIWMLHLAILWFWYNISIYCSAYSKHWQVNLEILTYGKMKKTETLESWPGAYVQANWYFRKYTSSFLLSGVIAQEIINVPWLKCS